MKKICFSLLSLLFFGIGFSQIETKPLIEQYQLPNGLTIVLSENHDKPTVMGTVIVKAGSKNDPHDATGMAHYLEHMLFKGTKELGTIDYKTEKIYLQQVDSLYEVLGNTKDEIERAEIQKEINDASKLAGEYAIPNELDQMLSEIGSKNVNAFTSPDITAYFDEFPSNKMEEWMSIYSHRFIDPVFRLFQAELETVYEEKNRGEESFLNHAFEVYLQRFFKKHPYGTQTTIGTTEHLKNPSLKKMYEFFDTYYVANNMILCLVGDFNTEEVKPLIEEYFSDWRTGEVPVFPEYKEEDFKPNESHTIAISPIKAFVRGYRTPVFGTYDQMVMEVVSNVLSNSQNSGLFDLLINDGKLMALEIEEVPFQDHGATLFFCVPKIIGQSFDKANRIIDEELNRLMKGDFEDNLFEGAKNEWINNFEKSLESNENRAFLIGEIFAYNKDWDEYMANVEKMKSLKKEEMIEVAKRYFGKNNFTLYSKMGKYKPEKLDKPDYDPIIPNNETNSVFYNKWKGIKGSELSSEIISYKDQIQFENLSNGAELKVVKNPINDLFQLDIIWEVGTFELPELDILKELMDISSDQNHSLTAYKNKLYSLGTNVHWNASKFGFSLSISGLDSNFDESMELIGNMLKNPIINDFKKQTKTISRQVKITRKMDRKATQFMLNALQEYTLYGEDSHYLRQAPAKAYKQIKEEEFLQLLKQLGDYKMSINYSGKLSPAQISESLDKWNLKNGTKTNHNTIIPFANHEFDVFFYRSKNSIQSHINFIGIGEVGSIDNILIRDAFNLYFGLDMSSILFQEIREFRSLAYSTYGLMAGNWHPQGKTHLSTYVGCQGDKTPEALELLHSLIKDMPVKTERETTILNSMKNRVENSNPGFRKYAMMYENTRRFGEEDNMNLLFHKQLPDLKFEAIIQYYQENVQNLPLKLSIVGDSKLFDKNILEKYGKVKKIKAKQIYRM